MVQQNTSLRRVLNKPKTEPIYMEIMQSRCNRFLIKVVRENLTQFRARNRSFFCAFLPLDKGQFDRPTMVDYAGIFIKSTVRINKFQFAVLCDLHKKSRNLGPDPDSAPHMASPLIAGRGRPRGPEFPPPRPYANFSVTTRPTRPICSFPETKPRAH